MTSTSVDTDAPPIVTAATGLLQTLWTAQLRGLPIPFACRVHDYDAAVELQFHTGDEVVTWAEALDVDLDSGLPNIHATGVLLDVEVTVCAYVTTEDES